MQEFEDYGNEILDAIDSMRTSHHEKGRPIKVIERGFGGFLVKKVCKSRI